MSQEKANDNSVEPKMERTPLLNNVCAYLLISIGLQEKPWKHTELKGLSSKDEGALYVNITTQLLSLRTYRLVLCTCRNKTEGINTEMRQE